MNTMVGHVIAEFYYYNQWKPSIPSTLGAIWGPWNSMDLSMECLEFPDLLDGTVKNPHWSLRHFL
jgi:hypothetical protein